MYIWIEWFGWKWQLKNSHEMSILWMKIISNFTRVTRSFWLDVKFFSFIVYAFELKSNWWFGSIWGEEVLPSITFERLLHGRKIQSIKKRWRRRNFVNCEEREKKWETTAGKSRSSTDTDCSNCFSVSSFFIFFFPTTQKLKEKHFYRNYGEIKKEKLLISHSENYLIIKINRVDERNQKFYANVPWVLFQLRRLSCWLA